MKFFLEGSEESVLFMKNEEKLFQYLADIFFQKKVILNHFISDYDSIQFYKSGEYYKTHTKKSTADTTFYHLQPESKKVMYGGKEIYKITYLIE